jgi:alpha-D-ribose 1-methylphosphonate 5-triphosphate diphosphatase
MIRRISGARVLLPDGEIKHQSVTIKGGLIAAIGADDTSSPILADGLLLLPGIVDLHGDAFERQLMPRPMVGFPADIALLDTDRQLLANGVTTALHGVTWSWEPGLRGRQAAVDLRDALIGLRPHLGCDTHIHLRFETFNIAAAGEIEAWLKAGYIKLLAFNNHLPAMQRRLDHPAKLAQYAERAHLSVADFATLIRETADKADEVPAVTEKLAAIARGCGIAMASHDDDSPAMRGHFQVLGCDLCEFPMTLETAQEARRLGSAVIMGAPNVLRGGSHQDRGIAASSLTAAGLVDVLASDYYYPALFQAAFRLVREDVLALPAAWQLVSANPARLAGFADRGVIAKGRRADLILVDDRDPGLPRIMATFAGGRLVHSAPGFAR